MRIKEINLRHYRNYEDLALCFSDNVNVFLGENAQGKTNLLESIYVLAFTKSHRTHNDKELIKFGEHGALVRGLIEKKYSDFSLEISISSKGKKTKINHIDQKKLSDYVGLFQVILFSPEDLYLIKGSPQNRRKFIDMELGQIRPLYLYELVQYQGILKQRNAYLKKFSDKDFDSLYFSILTEQLVKSGSIVLHHRLNFLKKLESIAEKVHGDITHHQEKLTLHYDSVLKITEEMTVKEIEEVFADSLSKNLQRERFKQTTVIGPHRDDLYFEVNKKNVQNFGSQGQQRTTALSLKLAEIDLIFEETGEYPVLLLDDVLSELDNERQIHLIKTIENKVQTFITTTTLEHIANKMVSQPTIYNVNHGTIKRERNE